MFSYKNVYFCCTVPQGLRELKHACNSKFDTLKWVYFGETNMFVFSVVAFFHKCFLTAHPLFKINKKKLAFVICAFLHRGEQWEFIGIHFKEVWNANWIPWPSQLEKGLSLESKTRDPNQHFLNAETVVYLIKGGILEWHFSSLNFHGYSSESPLFASTTGHWSGKDVIELLRFVDLCTNVKPHHWLKRVSVCISYTCLCMYKCLYGMVKKWRPEDNRGC